MNHFRLCAIGLAAWIGAQPVMAADQAAPPTMTAEQSAAVQRAMTRGQMMQVYDQAAWITTDDLLAKLPVPRRGEVGGWVVTPAVQGVHIDYVGKDAHAGQAVYSADVVDGKIAGSIVHPADALPALGDLPLRMVRALTTARAELARHDKWGMCANAMPNSIVLPPDATGTIAVYLMTPQVETGKIPFGGHYEIDVAADGSVKSARAFTNSCLTMSPQKDAKGDTVGLFMTHLLDPQPTEIHVFEQIAAGMPVYVGTTSNELVWEVRDGKITLAGRIPKN